MGPLLTNYQSEAPISLESSSLKTIPTSVEGEKSEQSPQSKVTLLLNQVCVLGYAKVWSLSWSWFLVLLILQVGKVSGLPTESSLIFMSNYTSRLNNLKKKTKSHRVRKADTEGQKGMRGESVLICFSDKTR